MNKTDLFEAHVLAEVRPLVSNMPEQQYVAQTDGSARMRVAKFENGRYRVRGVPGHTHNSTAICNVEGDFTALRAVDLVVDEAFSYVGFGLEQYDIGEFSESVHFNEATEVAMYDRAIEKGIGNIRLIPENCHQEIDEPTRAIAEIRTIVSSKQQLDSLTYIDEMGSHVDATTGLDATEEFVAQVPVYILGLRGSVGNGNRYAESRLVFTRTDYTLAGVFAIADPVGTIADTGAPWDGTRLFEWDQQSFCYVAKPLSVNMRVIPITLQAQVAIIANGAAVPPIVGVAGQTAFDRDNNGADDAAQAEEMVRIDFAEFRTTSAANRNCLIRHGGAHRANDEPEAHEKLTEPDFKSTAEFFGITEEDEVAEIHEPLFPCTVYRGGVAVTALQGHAVRRSWLHGMPGARIPVGRAHVIYGGIRRYDTINLPVAQETRYYGGEKSVTASERVIRLDPIRKVPRFYADIDTNYTYVFAAGALTLTDPNGVASELDAGVLMVDANNSRGSGFDYAATETNNAPPHGPFAVRMKDSFLCNDVTAAPAGICGGSIFGRMQAYLGTSAPALLLVAAVAAGATHNPNSVALQALPRFTTTAVQANLASPALGLDSGNTLHDIFRMEQVDLQPEEVLVFNNASHLFNMRALSTSFRNFEQNPTSDTLVLSQEIDDVLTNDHYLDDNGAQQAYYDTYIQNTRSTMHEFAAARANTLTRHTESRPCCYTTPVKIGFVHDRLTVHAQVFAGGYTYDNAAALLANAGAGVANSSEGVPCLPAIGDAHAALAVLDASHVALAGAPNNAGLIAAVVAATARVFMVCALYDLGTEMNERIVAQGGEAVPVYSQFVFREHLLVDVQPLFDGHANADAAYNAAARLAYDVLHDALLAAGGNIGDASAEDQALQADPSFALRLAFDASFAALQLGLAQHDTYPIAVNNVPEHVVTQAHYNLRFTVGGFVFPAPARYDATNMVPGYCEPVYNNTLARDQQVKWAVHHGQGANRTAVVTYCNYFTAVADVLHFGAKQGDATKNTCTTSLDKQPYYTRLSSRANAASVLRYGTSADTVPVRILTEVHASNTVEHYGYPYRGTGADAATAASGYGDQLAIPFANITYDQATGLIAIKGVAFVSKSGLTRYCYIICSDVGRALLGLALAKRDPTVLRFDMSTARLEMRQEAAGGPAVHTENYHMYTVTSAQKFSAATNTWDAVVIGDFVGGARIAAHIPTALPNGGNGITHCLVQFDSFDFVQDQADGFGFRGAIEQQPGLVFRSRKRVSQPMCAPILNPNVRIQCGPPLNFDSRHLPPEMRDFDLLTRDIDFSFLPRPTVGDWQLGDLRTFEFAGGNQVQTATDSLLYLPQFKLYTIQATDKEFDQIIYTSNGMPSYLAFYCRYSDNGIGLNYNTSQPRIETLNIACDTTKRKSNVVTDNLGKHHLFHLTMRNVHPSSSYNSTAYNKRQIVLLAAEDIGLMKLKTSDYQSLRRVRFQFSGTCNQAGTISVVFVYNNRGLEIRGADIKVVHV